MGKLWYQFMLVCQLGIQGCGGKQVGGIGDVLVGQFQCGVVIDCYVWVGQVQGDVDGLFEVVVFEYWQVLIVVYGQYGVEVGQFGWQEGGVGWQWVDQVYVLCLQLVQQWDDQVQFFVVQVFVFVGMWIQFEYGDVWCGNVEFVVQCGVYGVQGGCQVFGGDCIGDCVQGQVCGGQGYVYDVVGEYYYYFYFGLVGQQFGGVVVGDVVLVDYGFVYWVGDYVVQMIVQVGLVGLEEGIDYGVGIGWIWFVEV